MSALTPDIEARLRELAAPLAESLDLAVWGLELVPGGRAVLRLFVEGADGVDIEQCAELSRLYALALEVEDLIPNAYVLEVSSPGLDRIFFSPEQLAAYAGKEDFFELQLLEDPRNHPGRKNFNGRLLSFQDGLFIFQPCEPAVPGKAGEDFAFAWAEVRKIRRIHHVPAPQKPVQKKSVKDKKAGEPSPDAAQNTGSGGSA